MAVKLLKQNTSARRNMSTADFSVITKKRPEKSLIVKRKQKSGRNNQGKITIRHRGGGVKRHIRMVDFKLDSVENAKIIAIEYDPNRTAYLALVQLENGTKAYIPATTTMRVGKTINAGNDVEIKAGNRLPLKNIPLGSVICNIEMKLGGGAQIARSAGARAQLAAKEGKFVQIKLPSGEVRLIHQDCKATLGQIGNIDHQNIKIGSAGRKRKMGLRPQVRGKAMNPVDHPHGGGEGSNPIGLKHPKTPWGKPALGKKTRRRKSTDKMIVRGRKKGKR
ncbi:MAG TPA: 50S ribosomal protein L2 [Candidatus Saccharibacteria bacterium]|nr:50S ribosomal protein L2 [Candidatus Saccharibacteria bacterium]HMT39580.1 50S ribosomal protein L2 [Candidatus Saccharibacteria bacterium]